MNEIRLTKAECEAVASYIWHHSRSSPNGKAYKVWEKMWALISYDTPATIASEIVDSLEDSGEGL